MKPRYRIFIRYTGVFAMAVNDSAYKESGPIRQCTQKDFKPNDAWSYVNLRALNEDYLFNV